MTRALTHAVEVPLAEFAKAKLCRVLGPALSERVFRETLQAVGLVELQTADDLYAFGDHLTKRGGFEAAVGGPLLWTRSCAAPLRASAPHSRKFSISWCDFPHRTNDRTRCAGA